MVTLVPFDMSRPITSCFVLQDHPTHSVSSPKKHAQRADISFLELMKHQSDQRRNSEIVQVIHQTKRPGGPSPLSKDFRIDMAGSNAGTMYGRGCYLAENCNLSDGFLTRLRDQGEGLVKTHGV